MTAPARKALSAADLYGLLEHRYHGEGWALFGEIQDATGARSTRAADALAMSLWPSRGLEVHGFEIKVSRSDLVRELRDPAKSAPIQRYCDRWWLVLADASMLQPGECPPTWGVLVAKGKRLEQLVAAPTLDATPIDRRFLASILRQARRHSVPKASYDALAARIDEDAREMAMRLADDSARSLHRELERKVQLLTSERDALQISIDSFQEASGIKLERWNCGHLGRAVKILTDLHLTMHRTEAIERTRRVAAELSRTADNVATLASALERAFQPQPPTEEGSE